MRLGYNRNTTNNETHVIIVCFTCIIYSVIAMYVKMAVMIVFDFYCVIYYCHYKNQVFIAKLWKKCLKMHLCILRKS